MRSTRVLEVLRKNAGLSQLALAELVGRNQPDISNWERGLEIPRDLTHALFDVLMQRIDFESFSHQEVFYNLKPAVLGQVWEEFHSESLRR